MECTAVLTHCNLQPNYVRNYVLQNSIPLHNISELDISVRLTFIT